MITDNFCPWCYVGKRRWEAAFAQFPDVRFTVDWIPCLLSMPPDAEPLLGQSVCVFYRDYLCTRYGEQSAQQMLTTVLKAGESVGIRFNSKRPILKDTIRSHCLIQYAKRFGKCNQAVDSVMKAYFEDGRDISEEDVLVEIAESIGLNPTEVRNVISDPKCHDAIRRTSDEVKKTGITSVPTYIVTRPHANFRLKFSGAQTMDCFNAAIRQIIDPDSLCLAKNLPTNFECPPKKL